LNAEGRHRRPWLYRARRSLPVVAAADIDALANAPRRPDDDAGRPYALPDDPPAYHARPRPSDAALDDTTAGPHIFAVVLNGSVTGIACADPDVEALCRCSRRADGEQARRKERENQTTHCTTSQALALVRENAEPPELFRKA
jgi:hypothetical protein